MNISRTKMILAVALALGGGFSARAQSDRIPGDTDYSQFSQFITERNIFDPSRIPHTRTSTYRPPRIRRTRTVGEPYISLVGTMSYEKGLFVFFDSNNSDFKKILVANDEIAGYTVKEIAPNMVTLAGPDKKEFTMKIGDQMRQESGRWVPAGQGEAVNTAAPEPAAATDSSTTAEPAADSPAAAPSADLENNSVLKRLMEKRAKAEQ